MTLARHLGLAVLAALVIVVASIRLPAYRDYQMAEVAAYLTAVAGLTVLIGLSGQISIGHGAFMAIGGLPPAPPLLYPRRPPGGGVPRAPRRPAPGGPLSRRGPG